MPELPEVETVRLGIMPHVEGHRVLSVIVRHSQLRWPISAELAKVLPGLSIETITRRGKYLIFKCLTGSLIIHLGMSGTLRIVAEDTPVTKHDHVDICFDSLILRYNDPRRFGAMLWTAEDINAHPLIKSLGKEPLSSEFSAEYLFQYCQGRKTPIKSVIMNSQVVVGVGNIYAQEALFFAGILPMRNSGSLTLIECRELVSAIKRVLKEAIKQGGTTLKDFLSAEGKPGYFRHKLSVYGRSEKPCVKCLKPLLMSRINNRSTTYCRYCQI